VNIFHSVATASTKKYRLDKFLTTRGMLYAAGGAQRIFKEHFDIKKDFKTCARGNRSECTKQKTGGENN
jgi:hypothetical protein